MGDVLYIHIKHRRTGQSSFLLQLKLITQAIVEVIEFSTWSQSVLCVLAFIEL